MGTTRAQQNNAAMALLRYKRPRPMRPFRLSTVFDWEAEPVNERPRAFVPATARSRYSGASPFHGGGGHRSQGWDGFRSFLTALLVSLGLGVTGLLGLVHWLHG